VANSLNIVSIGIQNERAIVVFVIVQSRTRIAIVSSASGKRSLVELIDLLVSCGTEGDMYPWVVWSSLSDPEISFRRNPITEDGCAASVLFGDLHHHLIAEWCEGIVVKLAAYNRIANLKASVVDHDSSLSGATNIRIPRKDACRRQVVAALLANE